MIITGAEHGANRVLYVSVYWQSHVSPILTTANFSNQGIPGSERPRSSFDLPNKRAAIQFLAKSSACLCFAKIFLIPEYLGLLSRVRITDIFEVILLLGPGYKSTW